MRIYDRYLNLLTETDIYESLKFTRKFHSVGDFELTVNKYLQGAEHVKKGNLIALESPNKVGIILSREIALDESGKESENIVATGTTLCGIMDRRITVPPEGKSHDRKTSDAETVMKHYVEANFLNPVDPDRKMPNFMIAPNRGRGAKVEWESRYKNVAEELEKISLESGLGWEVHADFDNKRFIFDVVESQDLTQGNPKGNQPVFFSPDFENVKSMGFMDSDLDLRNYGYVGGQGEGEERKIIELGDVKGWNRFETFVDARDIGTEDEESEEELTEEEIEEMLIKRGESKMREMESVFSLEAEIITPITHTTFEYEHFGYRSPAQPMGGKVPKKQMITPFQYERDFNLGDRVEIRNKSWGLTLSTPIVEITETHEGNSFNIDAVFGEDKPTLISKLNRKFSDIEDIDKQEKYYEYVDKKNNELKKEVKPTTNPLWEGYRRMTATQTVQPSKKLTECKNGWMLQWQRYVSGEGTREEAYVYSFIPKVYILSGKEGQGMAFNLKRWWSTEFCFKYVIVHNGHFSGHDNNLKYGSEEMALTGVFEW